MHTVLTSKTRIFCSLNEVTLKTYISKNIIYSNCSSTERVSQCSLSISCVFILFMRDNGTVISIHSFSRCPDS